MKDNYQKIDIKSMKTKNMQNNDNKLFNLTDKGNLDRESFKLKLSKLENNIKTSNPLRDNYLNLNNQRNDLNLQLNNTWATKITDSNEQLNNVDIMQIKLNHHILENKIEKMKLPLIDENKYKLFKKNYCDSNQNEFNNSHVMLSHTNTNDKNYLKNYQTIDSNFNFSDYKIDNSNPAQSSENWKNPVNKFKLNNANFIDEIDSKNNLNKTLGNYITNNNPIVNDFISSNGFRSNYKKKDLAELNNKIELSKNRLNECIKKTETFIIHKRIEKNPFNNKKNDNLNNINQNNRINNYIRFNNKQDSNENSSPPKSFSYAREDKKRKETKEFRINYQTELEHKMKINPNQKTKKKFTKNNDSFINLSSSENSVEQSRETNDFEKNRDSNFHEDSHSNFNESKEILKSTDIIKKNIDLKYKYPKKKYLKNKRDQMNLVNNNKKYNFIAKDPIEISKEIQINIFPKEADIDIQKIQNNNNNQVINKNHNYIFDRNQQREIKKDSLPIIDKMYEKGLENYKEYLRINKEINERLILDKNYPLSTKNQNAKAFDNIKYPESASTKKSLYSNNSTKYLIDNYNNTNSNRTNERTEKSMNNEKLDKIENDISPIRNEVKVKFTEGELEEILSANLLDSERIEINNDFSSSRKTKNLNRDFTLNPASINSNLKDLISNELNYNDDNLKLKNEFNQRNKNNYFNQVYREYDNRDYENSRQDKLNYNYYSNIKTPENELIEDQKNRTKTKEKNQIIDKIFMKIPQIILNNQLSNDKIDAEYSKKTLYKNNHFAYLNNLIRSKPAYNYLENEPKNTTNDLLNEADNIIKKHFFIKSEKDDILVNKNKDLNESLSDNKRLINSKSNKKLNSNEENNENEINKDSKEDLNHKINYIYDILKNISNTKPGENILRKLKELKEKEGQRAFEKENDTNNYKNIEKIENNNNIIYLDNQRISFEMPRSKQYIDQNIQKKIISNEENKARVKEENVDSSPGMLLSPQSKSAVEDLLKLSKLNYPSNQNQNIFFKEDEFDNETHEVFNQNNLSNLNKIGVNLNNTDISEIKKLKYSELQQIQNKENNILQNPSDLIKKREEKTINSKIKLENPKLIQYTPEKREIKPSVVNPNGAQENNVALDSIESNNDDLDDDQNNNDISNENDNSDQLNGDNDENENSEEYELSAENNNSENENEKEDNEEDLDSNEHKVEDSNIYNAKKLENNNKNELNLDYSSNKNNTFTDEDNSQKDNSINTNNLINSEIRIKSRLKASSEKANKDESSVIKQKPKVKFILKHSLSTKTKNKIPENFENNLNNEEFNLNKKQNNSDFDFENEKVDGNIKTELNKNVISDTPYSEKSSDNRVKFSKKLVFIEYNDESVVEDIKVTDHKGNPGKHTKFNLLKYLIRLRNNKHKAKKNLRNYYNGIREDRLPKKLLSSLKKNNNFNEEDKEIGLQKLNEFLHECNKEYQLSDLQDKKKKMIIERNIREIQEIEEARKKGLKIKRLRSITPKKKIQSQAQIKNKDDSKTNFSKNLPNSFIKSFKNLINDYAVSPLNLIEKITGKAKGNVDLLKLVNVSATGGQNLSNANKINNKGINDFSLNSNTKKSEKEKEFKSIISNINLKELQNSLENDSKRILDMSEDINN